MAITINVHGITSSGGNNNQPPQPPTTPQQPTPQPPTNTTTSSQPQQNVVQPIGQTNVNNVQQPNIQQQTPLPSQQPIQTDIKQSTNNQTTPIQQQSNDNSRVAAVDNSRLANQNQDTARPLYNRPDFSQYSQNNQPTSTAIPTSDRLVGDIQAEISRRGIILLPGSPNYSNVINTIQQQQRTNVRGEIDNRYERKMSDIDVRKDALMYEINSRIESARKTELSETNDPVEELKINKKYDRKLRKETSAADAFFKSEYDAVEKNHTTEITEAEKRIAEAIQRITSNLPNQQTQQQQNNTTQPPTSAAPQPIQQQPTPQPQPQSQTPPQQPNNVAGGNQQQPIPPTPQPNQNGNNQSNRQTIQYKRPDFAPYGQSNVQGVNNTLPTSDRLVNDVRAEISRRGVILVPGTQNFSTMLNTMQQNQRNSVMGQIDNQYERKLVDIDTRKDALMYEIKGRLDLAKNDELSTTNDPFMVQQINKRYDRLLDREAGRVDKFFAGEYDAVEQEHNTQKADAEQRLTDALQRLTEELSQGNKDSYLNNLRDKYKEQVWRRDNAATEGEVREASREAAKIQERMQRAMGGGGGVSPMTSKLLGTIGSIATTGINTAIQLDRIGIKEDYVGFDMASSVLNGNATAAIRQRNAIEEQKNTTLWTGGGAIAGLLAGAAAGSLVGGVGSVPGAIVGLALGIAGGVGGNAIAHMANRDMMIEDERTRVADLWKQEESRIMQFNDLAMLYRGRFSTPNDIGSIRQILVDSSGERPFIKPSDENNEFETMDNIGHLIGGVANTNQVTGGDRNIWTRSDSQLDVYDLGYTAPEFAQQAARRIKQRGFVRNDSLENALEADALERVFSMNSGSLGQLSAYDRFGKNNANQDFTNLVYTLDRLRTTGMRNGQWARSDEFAGYMTQLQQGQRSTFLTVDNERAARQIATGQAIFGDKFGAEAMQGIQAVNQQVQKPGGGFQQTLLYDVIQELFPETRGDLGKIIEYQYSDKKGVQDEIQQAFAKRIESIYGGVDTTAGLLAMMDVYGIDNPNILKPIAKQLTNGGIEAQRLDKRHKASDEASVLNNGYTPEITQRVNAIADQQMKSLLGYQEEITAVVKNILDKVETSIAEKLQEAVDNLKQ